MYLVIYNISIYYIIHNIIVLYNYYIFCYLFVKVITISQLFTKVTFNRKQMDVA